MTHAPYELIADEWIRERQALRFREQAYIDRFLALTVPGAHILDVGCGAAAPIARYVLDHGYHLTGVDASPAMLRVAQANCPDADFVAGDIRAVQLPGPYDGMVAWDSIFHIPKAQHEKLFHTLAGWLAPDAPLLLSLGGSEGEFMAPLFGIDFFYSAHSPGVSLRLLEEAGFEILLAEIDDPSSRGHLAVLCRKVVHRPLV